MLEIRIHGRGGQGVVTAAELLSVAAFRDGHEAQAFPSFGSERMGAPVVSYCRIADAPIRLREPVSTPDAVIVVDSTLLHHVDVFSGLVAGGYVLINSTRSVESSASGTWSTDPIADGSSRSPRPTWLVTMLGARCPTSACLARSPHKPMRSRSRRSSRP